MPTYRVNDAGVAKARELIDAEQYVLDSEWSDAQPDADAGNAHSIGTVTTVTDSGTSRSTPTRASRPRSTTRSSTATSTACTAAG